MHGFHYLQRMIDTDFFRINRFPSHQVSIGNRPLGGNQPIRLQSMTNTDTLDIKATIDQTIRIIEAGADYVRISAPNTKAAQALKEIKKGVVAAGFNNPLIADIHFNPEVALLAAQYVEKVRINPGNYIRKGSSFTKSFTAKDTDQDKLLMIRQLKPLVDICKDHGTAIRIGTNMGSLSPRIVDFYGNTPKAMMEATFEFMEVFEELNFNDLIISLKASKPIVMIEAYELMVKKMMQHNMSFPLHIGITEAGEGENGRIKSALGICSLLNKGIGDTLRVSLTEAPEQEIPFARKISSIYQFSFTRDIDQQAARYTLEKSDFSNKALFWKDTGLKAVVIESMNREPLINAESADKNTRDGNGETAGLEKQNPDFWYCTDQTFISDNPDLTYLIPSDIHLNTDKNNLIPVYKHGDQKYIESDKATRQYFLRVDCPALNDDLFRIYDNRLAALILTPDDCPADKDLKIFIRSANERYLPLIIKKRFNTSDPEELICHFSMVAGSLLLEGRVQGIWIEAPQIKEDISTIAFGFLQSTGLRITHTEYISCPTCARTSYNLQEVLKNIQQSLPAIAGLKIAVMGCIVNGPGEMADADFGFVGTGTGKLHLYKGKNVITKNIEPAQASETLIHLLKQDGYL